MEGALDELLRHPALWRARDAVCDGNAASRAVRIPTGFAALDARLPNAGWPLGALVEVLCRESGIGELSLLLPALAELSRAQRWLAWIAPPHHIAIPALEARGVDPAQILLVRCASQNEALWAAEQALRSGACGAVLLWLQAAFSNGARRTDGFRALRRLQLAAEAGNSLGVVFRDGAAARGASPAALRLLLTPHQRGLQLSVLKSRGGPRVTVCLDPGAVARSTRIRP